MWGLSKSWNRHCVYVASILLLPAATGYAMGSERKVLVDAGHGGTDGGTGGNQYCDEKDMNLSVAVDFWGYLTNFIYLDTSVMTRYSDITLGLTDRANMIVSEGADAYVSVHHNCCNANYTLGVYCNLGQQAVFGRAAESQNFAEILEGRLYSEFLSSYGGASNGDTECCPYRDVCAQNPIFANHLYLKLAQCGPAVIGEGAFVTSQAGEDLCLEPAAINNEAEAYYNSVLEYYTTTAIGTNFFVTGYPGYVEVSWQDSDASASITYDILRARHCRGPFTHIVTVQGVNGQANYAYQDHTVTHAHKYYYYIAVSTGEVTQTKNATPSGVPAPSPPGVPTNIVATPNNVNGVGQVALTWTPTGATADGFWVYRRVFSSDLSVCTGVVVHRGTATSPAFTDVGVPLGANVYYAIVAYNATGPAQLSSPVGTTVATDAPETVSNGSDELRLTADSCINGLVRFRVGLPVDTEGVLEIVDVGGRRVATVVSGALEAGDQVVEWLASGSDGRAAAAGVYFARLSTPLGTRTAKVAVLR